MRKYDLLSIPVYEESVPFIMNQIKLKQNKDKFLPLSPVLKLIVSILSLHVHVFR